jgi:hypothetical protein
VVRNTAASDFTINDLMNDGRRISAVSRRCLTDRLSCLPTPGSGVRYRAADHSLHRPRTGAEPEAASPRRSFCFEGTSFSEEVQRPVIGGSGTVRGPQCPLKGY